MGIVAAGAATAVVVPDLVALSPDKIVQEIVVRDLRSRRTSVIRINDDDHPALEESTPDRLRTLVRNVLTRVDEHDARFAGSDLPPETRAEGEDDEAVDVIVEIIAPEPSEPVERIRPIG